MRLEILEYPKRRVVRAAVACLESLGILLGYPDGTFRPDRPINKAEFAAIAARFDTLGSTHENALVNHGSFLCSYAVSSKILSHNFRAAGREF